MLHRLLNISRFLTSIRFFLTRQLFTKMMSLLIIGSMLANTTPASEQLMIGSSETISVNPVIDVPAVLLVPPQPFTLNKQHLTFHNYSLLSVLGIWDYFSTLFGNPENSAILNSNTDEATPLQPPPSTGDLSRTRLLLKNQTGGTSLYSRNFSWGTGLAGLSGRGLDAGFGISYNSLIWTKVGSEMIFNPNNDNVTPGFRFGFPVIEPSYTDPLTSKNTYLMVTPSGSRVEFRQVTGSSDTFETADSSYIQLKIIDSNNLVITGTDGTNAFYQLKNGAFRCASIKDSNGNYITVNHDNNGLLQSVTDTLGRVINVSYDGGGQPLTITQQWSGGTHTYATFSYSTLTVNTNFSGLSLVGIANNTNVKVLTQITYSDGSFTTFDYNNYGQVWKVSNYAADTHKLSHSSVNLDNSSVSSAQTDVPRFSEFRNWTENFNLNGSGVAQEVVIPVVYQENQNFTLPGGSNVTGTLLQVTSPDGVISKTFVGNSGWMEGIPVVSEDWFNSVKQRWNYTAYTQDDPNLSYILNPRAVETKVGDANNVRRTTIDYYTQQGNSQASYFGLVSEVKVYDSNQTSVLKRTVTEYNLDNAYLNRRIIGLPQKSELYDHTNALTAKVTYLYDEGNFSGTGQTISAINHDSTNYGAGFIVGRGNLTTTVKWDVTDPNNTSKAIAANRVKYNITGNQVSALDPLNREVVTSYTDNFDDNTNRNSFAYPTQITDPAGNSSTVKYRFETGANVYAQSPAPAGQSVGKQTQRIYDSLGRLEKETVLNTGAYTRYEYPTNGIQAKVFSTITDINSSNSADSADEVLSESFSDGAGRVLRSRTEHPGSSGGWSATLAEYDVMGRVKRSTVPTEVNSSWQPAGDDAGKGWTWNAQEYDWKGRVTRQINTDGTDKLISYEGCGCAGGQVTTVQGELVPRDDNPSQTARRTQKVYEDILGRTYKTETLNWNATVYSTQRAYFNGRDQVTTSREYAGNDSSGTYQDTIMTYDGYGRLKTQKRPEQNNGTATVYNYYADDRIQQVVDARGATVNYQYNSRGLVTEVSTTSPNTTTIPNAPTVTYSYDNVGNRTQMTDGLGNVVYEYNQLSQLTAETRQFNDSLPNAPLSNNRFKLEYGYSLSGQLKFYKDAYGQQINYSQDKLGRLNSVTGSTAFGGVTTYSNNPQYRAWGVLKNLTYGNSSSQLTLSYNNRLQAASYQLTQNGTIQKKDYQYLPSGELSFIDDTSNVAVGLLLDSNRFDRSFKFDHLGRTTQTRTGAEAHGGTDSPNKIPYSENFSYDVFGHTTQIDGTIWNTWNTALYTPTYVNNRATNRNYDADGNEIGGGYQSYLYNATGSMVFSQGETVENTQFLDGSGAEIKRSRRIRADETQSWSAPTVSYFIRSSLLGIINEVKADGAKERGYVYGGETVIARQLYSNSTEQVDWEHYDVSGMTLRYTTNASYPASTSAELNETGNDVGLLKPISIPPPRNLSSPFDTPMAQTLATRGGCVLDGIEADCSYALGLANRGGARQCPNNDCSPRRNASNNGWIIGGFTEIRDKRQPPTLKNRQGQKRPAVLPFVGNEDDPIGSNWQTGQQISHADAVKKERDLYNKALKKLSDPNCNAALSGIFDAKESITRIANKGILVKETEVADPATRVANTFPRLASDNDGYIEFYKKFFDNGWNINIGNTDANTLGLDDDTIRLIIYLHEIAHLARHSYHPEDMPNWLPKVFSDFFVKNGGKTNAELNEIVYLNCGFKKIPQGVFKKKK